VKSKVETKVEKPVIKEAEKSVTQVATSTLSAAPVATQPQHFPTTKQFDTSLEEPQENGHNWSSSFFGLSTERFPKEVADILLEPVNPDDVEIKPGM
jgi:hypothetical protein